MHLVAITTFTHQQYCAKAHMPFPGARVSANSDVIAFQLRRTIEFRGLFVRVRSKESEYLDIILRDFFLNGKLRDINIKK
jgi:hypothetical protein